MPPHLTPPPGRIGAPARVRAAAMRDHGLLRFTATFLAVAGGIVLAWWALVAVTRPPPFLLPGPERVAAAFVARFPELMSNAAVTGGEILLGLALGVGLGVMTALLTGLVPWTTRLVQPVVVVLQALPVFAIAPVLVLWLGFGLASKVVMAAIVIFFPVASALSDAVARTDPGLLDLARLHRATTAQTFRHIRLPGAVPGLVSGLRMAATLAPIGAIIGEWVGASSGLGLMMMHANARMQTDVMFAALALVAAMALGLRLTVDLLTRRWAPWAPESGASLL
ncbi:MAG: ABC transporter permease [Siculibacillus sp.]|nr:ABC transporter permease [Siculibacillus sp.]